MIVRVRSNGLHEGFISVQDAAPPTVHGVARPGPVLRGEGGEGEQGESAVEHLVLFKYHVDQTFWPHGTEIGLEHDGYFGLAHDGVLGEGIKYPGLHLLGGEVLPKLIEVDQVVGFNAHNAQLTGHCGH